MKILCALSSGNNYHCGEILKKNGLEIFFKLLSNFYQNQIESSLDSVNEY